MSKSPPTRATLLARLRNGQDQVAWNQFVEIYAPLLHAYAMHNGMQDADAADLSQDVLQSVADSIKAFEYDPQKGSFRGWLLTITRNRMRRLLERKQKQAQGSGDTVMQEMLTEQPGRPDDDEFWNKSHQMRLFKWAAEKVKDDFKESTFQAFWRTAVDNANANAVATELSISVGSVYVAKSRVMARIREVIQSVEPDAE